MSARSWPEILGALTDGVDLTAEEAAWAIDEIFSDNASQAQIAAFGVAMKMKGPTALELTGLAAGMLAHARRVRLDTGAIDIVGTGGDRSGTVNISTMSSIVVSAAGVPVVKHGNRALSSKSGGADVLEALGVRIALGPEAVARCVREVGIGFCFAPLFHPALRFAGPARKDIGIPTVFNVLGPLTNPAQPRAGLIGCAFPDLVPVIAGAFAERGADALVVRGNDGLDEITTADTTAAWVVTGGRRTETTIDPTRLGIARVSPEALRGGDAEVNAAIAREMFGGKPGPVRDAVLLNSAAALTAYNLTPATAEKDIHDLLAASLQRAAHAVDSGAATKLLERWATVSNRLAED
ncbi:anthranilate phosphoribosyltransferase [Nocardia terpenica]|uniref:anthranilate phosphoribosyltransferase n=1 Tax=Nocardia terpenica TaxID=455432 RepID=UPI0018963DBC|nr:anthranilate phosphoribosyltransferase [Nocardia terpenica]MBF6064528.1 anthranilate phosphoribosyltransferase [Nocardia terpenica]MBF6106848.1 anthranilate phosphoribosyltransferase [Nocardia terpenica]MBF6114496.1 anthranilate phosphoribosyltransferase [Nocardia terpenica]MBF6121418.1 anthranilate phosphoribosyltransferase [Nocardia terpenica]MBF6153833.1 anthranilate phosphoribosyltransferase [Nocardia terpenica]